MSPTDRAVQATAKLWVGRGTKGMGAVYARHRLGYRGYVFRPLATGGHADVWFCQHAHHTRETAKRCGEREAARLNRHARLGAVPEGGGQSG